ncbi:MAG TPA: type I DNA topoisomerase [Bacilli bacterium]|nr:type I DNA topoisomerase [Bacilli bacterium]
MKLVIVESPAKRATIERYLGPDYEVLASLGHVRDLATRGKDGLGIDVDNGFAPTYINDSKKKKTIEELKKHAKKASEVILATDPDREGEAIAWHLADLLKLNVTTTKRLEFHEITRDAVTHAINNPRLIDMQLVSSQETRRMLDRIIGFKLSKLLMRKIKSDSAGRVQSAVLKLIVEHEKEIQAFIPEEYWNLSLVIIQDDNDIEIKFLKNVKGESTLKNEDGVKEVVANLGMEVDVIDVRTYNREKEPKLPFTTSTLQQEAYNRFNMKTKRIMEVAAKLYEGLEFDGELTGLITYMRTDSARLSDTFVGKASNYITNNFGENYLRSVQLKRKLKATEQVQDAHEAIRPTDLKKTPEILKSSLTKEQYNIYRLIYARALASLMPASKDEVNIVTFGANGNTFKLEGNRNIFDGYQKVYGEFEANKDVEIGVFHVGEKLLIKDVNKEQKFTQPPSRYSEARVVRLMEEKGIGRPSTYASTIDLLGRRKYVESKSGVLTPTEKGIFTVETLDKFFTTVIDSQYTASMEQELDDIASGKLQKEEFLTNFYGPFVELVALADQGIEKVKPKELGEDCPTCGKPLIYQHGKFGEFISCSNFPECRYTRSIIKYTGEICPTCGFKLVEKYSRAGKKFIGCSNYPNCTYIQPRKGFKPRATE